MIMNLKTRTPSQGKTNITMDNGQITMDNGQITMDNGQITMDSGQWQFTIW